MVLHKHNQVSTVQYNDKRSMFEIYSIIQGQITIKLLKTKNIKKNNTNTIQVLKKLHSRRPYQCH